MRPSSSRSDGEEGPRPSDGGEARPGLFDGVLARGPVREEVSDRAWLQAMLDAEAALAEAQVEVGMVAPEVAEVIRKAADASLFDVERIGREAADTGNPVVPMLAALRARVGAPAADVVHVGATSQDVVDTAAMLVAWRALGPLVADVEGAAAAAASMAERHRSTPIAGRTLLQQASAITFGLKAAGWMHGLDRVADRLVEVRRSALAAQLGGAAGSLAALGSTGLAVAEAFARRLGLAAPSLPWHTERSRIAEVASALGEAAGAVGKPALDVVLLAQTEVGEVREGVAGRGGSSAMPHKANPVAAVSALAGARRAPGLVAELLGAGLHEHERAAGAWHAEWRPFSELLVAVGSAAAWVRDCLEHLEIDPERMHENLGLLARLDAGAASADLATAEALVDRALAAHRARGSG